MGYPKPDGYVGSGIDGCMQRQGSAGHEGRNPSRDNDIGDRRNVSCNDGEYFSGYEVCEEF